ncbi:MAG: NAD-binding protein [Anaerolineae bacterium]|jgi:trk system potassium uptake protein TrkA|nr:NAD-binding protein [Anaerolineae bacterium]
MRVIIIGGSKTVYFLARQFVRRKYHVTIINRDANRAREIAQQTKATVVLGEGTDVHRLEEAGARQADVLLAVTNHDQDNLIACQIAQKMFGVPRTIALVNDPDNEEIFKKLGVNVAFSATRIIGSLLDQETDFEEVMSLMPLAQGRINVSEIRLDEDSPAVGKTLLELEISENSLVATIIRGDEVIVPRGSTRLEVNDHLLLISQPQHEKRDLAVICGSE